MFVRRRLRWSAGAVAALCMSVAIAACGSSSESGAKESSSKAESSSTAEASSTAASSSATEAASSGESAGTIPVTFVGDETGLVAFVGKEVLKGMEVAVKRVNSSGMLHGKKIKLTVMDTASNVSTATVKMSDAAKSNAVAVFGPLLSNEALATAPIAERGEVVDIETEAEVAGLLPIGKYIYRLTPSEFLYYPLTVDHLAKLGVKRVNMLYASDNPTLTEESTKLLPEWLKKVGISIGTSTGIPSTTTEFSSIATKLESGKPEAIGVNMIGPAIASVASALRTSGYKGRIFADQSATAGSLKPGGSAANGILFGVLYSPEMSFASSKEFTKLFEKAYPGQVPQGYDATGYDAMIAFADAVAKSGSATRAGVLKGMQELAASGSFDGASGPLKFTGEENREVSGPGALVEWREGAEHLLLQGTPGLESQPLKAR